MPLTSSRRDTATRIVDGGSVLPCTSTQAGMVFETITRGELGLYVEQVAVVLREPVNVALLREAWVRMAARHEAFRLSFVLGQETPLRQRIVPAIEVPFAVRDWRELEPAARGERWRDLLSSDRQVGFTLESAPLFRVALCLIDACESRMLFTHHHAIIDGFSGVQVQLELFSIYAGLCTDTDPALAPAPSFGSFLEWVDRQPADEAALDFWRAALAGIEAPTPAPALDDGDGDGTPGAAEVRVGPQLSQRLVDLARRCEVSVGELLQAAFAVLLSQETGQEHLLYATTRAGRRSPPMEAQRMVGMLMVASPMCLQLPTELSFGAVAARIRWVSRAARPFEHMPIATIRRVSELAPKGPFTEVLFNFQPLTVIAALRQQDEAWQTREIELFERNGQALTINVFGGEDIVLQAEWDGLRCTAGSGRRFVHRLADLLDEVAAADPEIAIGELGTLPAPQRRALSGELVGSPPAAENLIPVLIAAAAASHPDRTAITEGGAGVTYAELDMRAAAIAAQLAHRGVAAGQRVGIATRRSSDMVAAVLAVHRVGAAYVPLDRRYPMARLGFMLADSDLRVVVADADSAAALPHDGGERLILDDCPPSDGEVQVAPLGPDTLSHVIYTSGSTGVPKGVMIDHGSVGALVAWARTTFSAEQRDGVLASTSLSFDLSVFELLTTIALDGTVVLVDDLFALSEPSFNAHVALVNSVPSLMTALLAVRDLPGSVRTVTLAGEPLSRELVDRLYAQPSVEEVWNLYGPTEDTTYSTAALCARREKGAPSIGRPLPGTQAYVVNAALRPVAPGVQGELLLGGAGLARGYLGRPELTAQRFIPNPFGSPPSRLYRTGDRASWRADGTLAYHGRLDDQVKIHGYRIEPAEVRSALLEDPDIEDAAVVARGEGTERKLVAYLVPRGAATLDTYGSRQRLSRSLPPHMVPSAIVVIGALPLTANGKLDREALPAPSAPDATTASLSVGEAAMAALWQELLDLEAPPAPGDDFYALGGDSFAALALLAGIEARFGTWLGAEAMLEATTLSEMAARLELQATDRTSPVIALRAGGSRTPWFFAVADHRAVIGMRNILPTLMYDQPVYAVHAIDPTTPSWRTSSVETIAENCLNAIREHQPSGPYRLGGYSLGGYVGWELACRLESLGERVELMVLLDTFAPEIFTWRGRVRSRQRELVGASARRRARGYAGLVRERAEHAVSLMLPHPPGARPLHAGFDDPWDQAGAMRLAGRYRARPLTAPVVVYYTHDTSRLAQRPTLGWESHATGSLEAEVVPGDHHSVLSASDGATFAALLAERLERLGA